MIKTGISLGISLALTLTYIILSFVFSLPLVSTIVILIKVIPLVVLLCNINSTKKGRKILLTAITYLVFIAISFSEALITDHAPLRSLIVKSISSVFPLLPLIIITAGERKDKKTETALTVLVALASFISFEWTNDNYYYLYSNIEHYSLFLTYSRVLFLLTILVPLSDVVFGTDKNYLSLSLISASLIMSFPYYWAMGRDRWYINPLLLDYLLILLIYITRERKMLEVGERRIVKFTRVADIEIEHLQKKKKKSVYELPPNVPIDDRDKA